MTTGWPCWAARPGFPEYCRGICRVLPLWAVSLVLDLPTNSGRSAEGLGPLTRGEIDERLTTNIYG